MKPTTQRLREAVAAQGSHWLAQCLVLNRQYLAVEFSAGKASVSALIRAELARRGVLPARGGR